MISTNTSGYKVKTAKGHKDAAVMEGDVSDESGEQDGDKSFRPYKTTGSKGRARSSEFRSVRAVQNSRTNTRGRVNRRGHRDYSDGYFDSRKYDNSRNGKFFETEKKNDIKLNLPEDTRISKLLRRLNMETNQDVSLQISKKLLQVLLLPDNAAYVRKAFHILSESMYEILRVSPGLLAKQQAALALGRMGYIMGQEGDFDRYQTWLFSKMGSSHEEMQILLMWTFKETFSMEIKKSVLQDYVDSLIHHLLSVIEVTENAEVFKSILDVLVTLVEMYPAEFHSQFRDTIDLLFGWHVDHTQPLANIEFISKNMQKLSHHFKYHLQFSVGLIENFMEDITNFSAELSASDNVDHVTVLILALNTVLKCLGPNFHPNNNKFVNIDFIVSCLNSVIKIVADALENFLPENLVIASNDCIIQLLSHLETKSQALSNSIYNLLDLQLSLINDFNDFAVVSMLYFVSKVIKELSANLPMDLIEKLIGPRSDIVKLRSTPFVNIQNAVICVYQSMLNLKNVSLLQEAYRYVLGDLERVYIKLVPSYHKSIQNNPYEDEHNEEDDPAMVVMFLLRCLSQLANASSIIVMWALKPSILELVGVNLLPFDPVLAKKYPYIQYSLLYLLYSHCKCYNHFISNSNLVTSKQESRFSLGEFGQVSNTSPNSGNFGIILDIIYKCLKIETSYEVDILILQWLQDILVNSDSYLEAYYLHEKFMKITNVLVKCGYSFNVPIIEAVGCNLEKLLSNKQLAWNTQFLTQVADLCKLHMGSNHQKLRENYTKLSANIPWDVAIVELNKPINIYHQKSTCKSSSINSYMVVMAQNLHLSGSVDGEMYAESFKKFMNFLLNKSGEENLEDIFTTCWTHDCASQMNMELFYDLAMNSRQVLTNWCTLEAAQFCVNYKLRTPLGKPNETFTKIESALNLLGNDLVMMKKSASGDRLKETNVNRVRLLLQFVEHLEKSIYNAAEGCAVAMSPPNKGVRSFFIANTNTCNEWFLRIRMVMMHIALHCGENAIAIKHGQSMLKDFVMTSKTSCVEFEKVSMFVTLALLNLREPEALFGLYSWCKTNSGQRFQWIKCAADQAAKRYEIAVDGYKKVILDEGNIEQDVSNFIKDQILVCYKELNNWTELFKWQSIADKGDNGKTYWFNTTDWDCNQTLFQLDAGEHSMQSLSTWELKNEESTWSVYENLCSTETNLYNYAVNNSGHKIDETLKVIQRNVRELLPLAPNEFLQTYSLLHYVCNGLKNLSENLPAHTVFLVSENFENEISKVDTTVLRKILWWSEYFAKEQNQGFNVFSSNLRLDVIKRARKEKNLNLAWNQLTKFFTDKGVEFSSLNIASISINEFIDKFSDVNFCTYDVARAMSELLKVGYCNEDTRQMMLNLSGSVSTVISKYADHFGSVEHRKISSKILLKLAGWMQSNEMNITELNNPLGQFIMVLPEIESANIIPLQEMAIGKLLQFSATQCPNLAKSWNVFGTWCYRWGKKVVDHNSNIKNNLSDEQCLDIKNLLGSDKDLNRIYMILSQTRSVVIGEEDIESNEINTTELIEAQLQAVLKTATPIELKSLVQIWKDSQKNIYNYYSMSAEAYFKYLHLVMKSDNNNECHTITITLRLLRLIVKYALELQNILEAGLQTTPTEPWKVIIPQLFSRLNHPESYVRHRVSDLLCRVAEDAPQLITFPAVVGALEGGLKFDFSEIKLPKDCLSQNNDDENDLDNDEGDNYDSDNDDGATNNTLQICFKTMVDTLSKQDNETISQVETLVKELRRITLLWDELWLGTLAQHQSEITKRQQQLEGEIEKVADNVHLSIEQRHKLIAEKHRIIIKPIIFVLEQLYDVTSVEPETPHEKQFQDKYMDDIKSVLVKLKHPAHPEKPQESLMPLKQLQKKFQQKFHKRNSYSLKMQDISPVLHTIRNTVIAMPGLPTNKKPVTIAHVSNVVTILPTKTKPKKLVFKGSDGQTYTYLFKGLEDLHLDERIMQFLSIANTMMARNADPSGVNLYRARHYSVIPLGPRSGLISWVDGTTPVFSLYKRWQQRELAKPNAKGWTTVPRPSELFYKKLIEHGVKNIDNRKEWPLSVLKDVLNELMAETPSDLIAKELWCNAISTNAWWQVVRRYSYSVAVMSIIGYIIGLGDRHLDNVLIDLLTGDVVHIDYNVCFEKGKTLRVPEKVPFRLTPNIRDALGVTGVEGIFRLACENVLKTMRKGRETLLTLLEAFVYDPLIDWTVGGEVLAGTSFGNVSKSVDGKRQTKRELEKEVTLAMFDVRLTEIKTEWLENKEEILAELPGVVQLLKTCYEMNGEIVDTEDQLQDLHQQLALVKEAEAQPKMHSLYKLPSHYDVYIKSQETMNMAKKGLYDIIKDCDQHTKAFRQLLTSYENQQFNQWLTELKFNLPEEQQWHIFDLVKEFLHNAGKDDVVTQCEKSEIEMSQLSQNLNLQTRKCIQSIQDYLSLLMQCPKSYIDNHRMNLYKKWATFLLEDKSVEGCDVVYKQFKSFLESKNQNGSQIISVAYTLDNFYKETLLQVNKLYAELTTIRARDQTHALETSYNQAKKNIDVFLSQDKTARNAMKFVMAGELLLLNRLLLTSEIAAQKSGNYLINLTYREGEWFLDDLLLYSIKAVELINNVPLNPDDDPKLNQIVDGVRIANAVYKGLYDLNFNFHTIILPETMKKIQADENSVLEMLAELNQVINESDVPIQDMLSELEKLLTCVMMHVDVHSTYDYVLEKINTTKKRYLALIPSQSSSLSQGKMLLMGFNGLFENINQEMNNLTHSLGSLDVPKSWKKLDHVKEAKNISPHIFNPQIKNILENIFFLKRILAIMEFFTLAQQMCQSIKCSASSMIYNDDTLTKPIRQFIADFISRQLLGVTPEAITYSICLLLQQLELDVTHEIEQKDIGAESKVPIDELYQKAYTGLLKDGVFTSSVVSQATSLETSLKGAWEKIQEPKKIEQKLNVLKLNTYRFQSQFNIHNLMFDEALTLSNFPSFRAKILLEIQSELTNLQSTFKQVKEAKERQQGLIQKAYQRLNWAKGANPDVVNILAAFEDGVKSRDSQLTLEQKIASNVMQSYTVVLQQELLRTSNADTTKEYDQMFLNCCDKWRQACHEFSATHTETLLPAEESILNMLSLDLVRSPRWLHQVAMQITDAIALYQKKLIDRKEKLFLATDKLDSLLNSFKSLYNIHSKLMHDIKGLLKTMSKIEDHSTRVQHFIHAYKKFADRFQLIFTTFKDKSLDNSVIESMQSHLDYVATNCADIYEGLLAMQNDDDCGVDRPRLRRQSCVETIIDKSKTESKVQQRNAYALNVWRRVKMKLEGRDPDPGRKCTAQEQVDYVIREATSVDNLALLYEGWTPWV